MMHESRGGGGGGGGRGSSPPRSFQGMCLKMVKLSDPPWSEAGPTLV